MARIAASRVATSRGVFDKGGRPGSLLSFRGEGDAKDVALDNEAVEKVGDAACSSSCLTRSRRRFRRSSMASKSTSSNADADDDPPTERCLNSARPDATSSRSGRAVEGGRG